jgi:hypothetical protein
MTNVLEGSQIILVVIIILQVLALSCYAILFTKSNRQREILFRVIVRKLKGDKIDIYGHPKGVKL